MGSVKERTGLFFRLSSMRTKTGIFLVTCTILLAPRVIVCAAGPSYQGKGPLYWLDSMSTNMEGSVEAFKAIGSNAVPFLIKTLEHKPSSLSKFVDQQLSDYRLRNPGSKVADALSHSLPSAYLIEDRRENALFLIGKIGPEAEAAIPLLFRIYTSTNEDWRIDGAVGRAIAAMGEKAVILMPDYLRWLKSDDVNVRASAAALLLSVGPKAKIAVPGLLEAAESNDRGLATTAARALWAIDRQTNVALRIFTPNLQSTNSTLRQLGLWHLREMGSGAKAAGALIRPLLRDPDDLVRREAEKALLAIDPRELLAGQVELSTDGAANVERLIRDVGNGSVGEKLRALEALAVFGPEAAPAVPALIEVLGGPVPLTAGTFGNIAQMNLSAARPPRHWGRSGEQPAPPFQRCSCACRIPRMLTTRSMVRRWDELALWTAL